MRKYKCHKAVHAEPMTAEEYFVYGKGVTIPNNMEPMANGYHIVYSKGTDDEYRSWSPKKAFDEGYRPAPDFDGLDFGQVISLLWSGVKMCRVGWNGKNMYLELQKPDEHSKMSLPYIYMRTAQGDLVPWLASQTDMLADDWQTAVV